jgi:hypothetical protein
MIVSTPAFCSPVLCIDDFLPEEDAQKILQEWIDLKRVYVPATIFDGPTTSKVDRNFRRNDVVYLNDVFRTAPERSDTLTIIRKKMWTEECKSLWHKGYLIFDIINYSTWQEAVVSRYGDGEFYKKHQDTRRDHITYRLVTLVYYLHRLPQQYTGGSLVLWEGNDSVTLEPKHNRAILFPSFVLHEVEKVSVSSERWEDARFSLNYWMGFL